MIPVRFSTREYAPRHQLDAWIGWFDSVFDVAIDEEHDGFEAESRVWSLDGFGISLVDAPSLRALRTKALVRRNPVDHWVITLGQNPTKGQGGDVTLDIPARVPFVVSLGRELVSDRARDTRLQLYLPRDTFSELAPALDAMQGQALDTPLGKLLGDYIGLLQRSLPELAPEDLPRLTHAMRSMVLACLAPSADHAARAASLIDLSRREKVRRAVERHLHAASLGPDTLCREIGMSRTQLYRLLHDDGGVARYIQRRRLLQAYADLSNPANALSITEIAERLCFPDASSFSRAFKHEFGMTPRDVRAAWVTGQQLSPPSGRDPGAPHMTLRECLRDF